MTLARHPSRTFVAWDSTAKPDRPRFFVNKHCVFATGPTDIGYGLPDDHPREQGQPMRAKAGASNA